MQIIWHGGSTIELSEKKKSLFLNPQKTQIKEASVVVFDRTDPKNDVGEGSHLVDWPGEYDVSGFSFRSIENQEKKGSVLASIFHTHDGDIAWMGEMKEYPSEAFLEELGEAHVLILPVGDNDVLSAKDAYRLVEAIEPLIVIPICYGDGREGLSAFLKEMDVKMPQAVKSFEVKKAALNEEQMDLVILQD